MTDDLAKLAADMQSDDDALRAAAAEQLAALGPAAAPACMELVHATADSHEPVVEWANAALEKLGPPPVEQLTELAELLSAESPLSAYWAATLLGRLGADAAPAVDQLAACLASNRELALRERAAWALGRIGPPAASATAALRAVADGDNTRLARVAGESLAAITQQQQQQ